ncbi:unnamed protein product, partial [Ectocarpus sp. 8 AP-2014]
MSARTFGSYCAGERGGEQLPTPALYLQVDSVNQRAFSTPCIIITSERQ